MRYRRYYTQHNSDGSRSVLSVGPVGSAFASRRNPFAWGFHMIFLMFKAYFAIALPIGVIAVIGAWSAVIVVPLTVVWYMHLYQNSQAKKALRRP